MVKELNNRELGPACKSSARLKMGGNTSYTQRCRNMHWGHGGAWLAGMKGA
jgi:thymidine kinase